MRKDQEQELGYQADENEEHVSTISYALAKGLIDKPEHDRRLRSVERAYRAIITEILEEAKA